MKKTKKIILLTTCIGIITLISQTAATHFKPQPIESNLSNTIPIKESLESLSASQILFKELDLEGKLNFDAFEKAMIGYENLDFKNKDIITVIDFTRPSTEKRMFVIDMKNKKVLFNTIVSHGRNSGEKYATSFSNKHGSYQSSLGFYTTENTYMGGNGYSLVLDGLEKGINDQTKPRAVVIHGADYCSQSVIKSTGRLGRSYGCPALPREVSKPIINTIKNGTMVFIYAEDQKYLASSKILKKSQPTMLAQNNELMKNDSSYITY